MCGQQSESALSPDSNVFPGFTNENVIDLQPKKVSAVATGRLED